MHARTPRGRRQWLSRPLRNEKPIPPFSFFPPGFLFIYFYFFVPYFFRRCLRSFLRCCFRLSLCSRGFFSYPEAIKMMDDFLLGVPCRVVFFLLRFCFPSLLARVEPAGGDATRVCFSRERLNVKQETATGGGRARSFLGGGREPKRVCIYNTTR